MAFSNLIFTVLLALQVALVVTGGAVRLTGSGLGCPTWPRCTPGSYTPVPHQVQGQLHVWIEFTNRVLTFLLLIAAVAAVVGAIKWGRNRVDASRIRNLAVLQLLGIIGQGVLGGITVLTHLNPIPVGGHFLLSIALIAGAFSLRQRMAGHTAISIKPLTYKISRYLLLLTIVVLTLGVIVTGSGPHAGDIQARRTGFDPRVVSWIHADSVIALLCLTIGLLLVIRASESAEVSQRLGKAVKLFLIISLAQGLIGYVQYFTGLPEIIVGAHLLGATLVWLAIWNVFRLGRVATNIES